MTGRQQIIKLLLLSSVFVTAIPVQAQTEKQLVPADLKQQTVVTEPVTLRKGYFRAGAIFNYRVADKFFNDGKDKEYYLTSSWGTKSAYNLTVQYGFSDRLEAELLTEYMYSKQKSQSVEVVPGTNTTTTVTSKQQGLGIGDTHLDIKYQLIPESKYRVSLTGIINSTFPTGEKNPTNIRSANQYDLPVGDGTYSLAGELYARMISYPYSFTAYTLYEYNFKGSKLLTASDLRETDYKLGNRIEGGLSANVHLNEWIVFANQFSYYHEGEGWVGNTYRAIVKPSWAAVYVPNLVFQVKRFRMAESVSVPLFGRNVPADPLYIITVQYVF